MNAYACKETFFTKEAGIGGAIEFDQVFDICFVVGELLKHRVFVAILRWNEAVRVAKIAVAIWRGRCRSSLPAPACIEQLANLNHARQAETQDVLKRSGAAKHWVGVGEGHPDVGQALAIENVESLEDADEKRDAGEHVLIEARRAGAFLRA